MLLLASLFLIGACAGLPPSPPSPPLRLQGQALGTSWTVLAQAPQMQAEALHQQIQARLSDLVMQMSAWEPESALSRLNRQPGAACMTLPPDLYQVLVHALSLARRSEGAYDPSIAPLVELWGFGPGRGPRTAPPAPADIDAARARVDWRRLQLAPDTRQLCRPAGWHLDINALGPGHAVDAIAQLMQAAGIDAFMVELGGEIRTAGRAPGGRPWRIAVEHPQASDEAAHFDTVVELEDGAIGTSGDYRAGFIHQGQRYSHTLDPRSGAPVRHALAAVSVIAAQAIEADGLAATLMVLGPEAGMRFAVEHNLAAVFSVRTGNGLERRSTPAFERYRAR